MKLSALQLATQLVDTLPVGRPGLFNPWRESCPHDRPINTTEQKLARLAAHLDCDAKLILVGEAPGYQGCRYSGVAFTSERQLIEGVIPRMPQLQGRLTDRGKPFSEPSATIVWRKLRELGIADDVILWNSVQLHPHHPGQPHTNRTPSRDESSLGLPALHLLSAHYPNATFVAIGKNADDILRDAGIPATKVRHPANGGANKFRDGLEAFINQESEK